MPPSRTHFVKSKIHHPTKQKLLETVALLLQEHSVDQITSDMILSSSGISKGSLYHHFEDVPHLIETTLINQFAHQIDQTLDYFMQLLNNSTTKEMVYEGLKKATTRTQSKELRSIRYFRARLISLSENNPRLAQLLAKEQDRLTDALTDLFRELQHRSWMSSDFEPRAAAVLIQAYTLGKLIDDIAETQLKDEHWNHLINHLILRVFF